MTISETIGEENQNRVKSVLITGATGFLGRQAWKAFDLAGWNVIACGYARAKPPKIIRLDLGSREEVGRVLDERKPDVLLHCAAERVPDRCASDPEGTFRLNVHSSRVLAEESSARGILMVYVSTDYVFGGRPGAAPYNITDKCDPANYYGETKRGGEVAILEGNKQRGIVLRIPVLYGFGATTDSTVNMLLDVIWNKDKKERVEIDHRAIKYPTNTEDVGRVLKDIAVKYTSNDDISSLPRILQFTAEVSYTRYEMCRFLAQVLGLPVDHVYPLETYPPDELVTRPYDCHLSTKALKEIGINTECIDFVSWWKRELGAFKR